MLAPITSTRYSRVGVVVPGPNLLVVASIKGCTPMILATVRPCAAFELPLTADGLVPVTFFILIAGATSPSWVNCGWVIRPARVMTIASVATPPLIA
ncbi:hypothetical protein D9M71_798860 [compost metagenome]